MPFQHVMLQGDRNHPPRRKTLATVLNRSTFVMSPLVKNLYEQINCVKKYSRSSTFTTVLEKTLKSPVDCKEIKPINPKGNQLCKFIRSTGAEAEAPVFWSPDGKRCLIGKDHDAGKD